MASSAKEVMIVVGEASGDAHGADLVDALHKRDATLKIYGVAGERLRQTCFEPLLSVASLTGMGLVELFGNLGNLWRGYRLLKRSLKKRRPSLLVLIDFPEFNLRLARIAKSLRIPVLYYVSPQIWAWRRGRIRQIARWVDQMAVIFPFEVEFYERHGVKVEFVGHPLLASVRATKDRAAVLQSMGLDPARPAIALLPGSRGGEISRHLTVMRDAAVALSRERETQFFCVCANTVDAAELAVSLINPALQIPIVQAERYDAIHAADLVWTASGTATLETGLLGRPMIIVYRLSWLTYVIARLLVRVEHIGMVNLICGERVVPELIQSEVNADRIAAESRVLLDNAEIRSQIKSKLARLRERLGGPGAAERVADLACSMIARENVAT